MHPQLNQFAYPRMAIYSQDGFGLGHMRRTNSIARQFLRDYPNACVLTLSDSPLGQLFGTEKNHDYLGRQ
jgi:predicted glycosyltransferase